MRWLTDGASLHQANTAGWPAREQPHARHARCRGGAMLLPLAASAAAAGTPLRHPLLRVASALAAAACAPVHPLDRALLGRRRPRGGALRVWHPQADAWSGAWADAGSISTTHTHSSERRRGRGRGHASKGDEQALCTVPPPCAILLPPHPPFTWPPGPPLCLMSSAALAIPSPGRRSSVAERKRCGLSSAAEPPAPGSGTAASCSAAAAGRPCACSDLALVRGAAPAGVCFTRNCGQAAEVAAEPGSVAPSAARHQRQHLRPTNRRATPGTGLQRYAGSQGGEGTAKHATGGTAACSHPVLHACGQQVPGPPLLGVARLHLDPLLLRGAGISAAGEVTRGEMGGLQVEGEARARAGKRRRPQRESTAGAAKQATEGRQRGWPHVGPKGYMLGGKDVVQPGHHLLRRWHRKPARWHSQSAGQGTELD